MHAHDRTNLLEARADVHAVNNTGSTPLWEAAARGDTELVSYLLEQGAEPLFRNSGQNATTPQRVAEEQGHTAAARIIKAHVQKMHHRDKQASRLFRVKLEDVALPPVERVAWLHSWSDVLEKSFNYAVEVCGASETDLNGEYRIEGTHQGNMACLKGSSPTDSGGSARLRWCDGRWVIERVFYADYLIISESVVYYNNGDSENNKSDQTPPMRNWSIEPGSQEAPPSGATADVAIVSGLTPMGFSENAAREQRFLATKNAGVQQATEWLFVHIEDPGLNAPIPDIAPAPPSDGGRSINRAASLTVQTFPKGS